MQRGLGDRRRPPKFESLVDLYKLPTADPLPQIWDLHGWFDEFRGECASIGAGAIPRTARPALQTTLDQLRTHAEKSKGYDRSVETLTTFFEGLPRVRRALANVPTYMVFDDHDVTDDWNIGRAWRDQVQTTKLGRRIISNALVAYALFQDGGNDPLRYRRPPFDALLRHAALLFPATGGTMPTGSVLELESLFGLLQADPEDSETLTAWLAEEVCPDRRRRRGELVIWAGILEA